MLDEVEARGGYVLAVTTTPKAWQGNKRLVGSRKRVRLGLGLHPEVVAERHLEVPLFEHLLPEADYVGEIGLDGGPHMKGSYALQETVLHRILDGCAAVGGRIMSIHSRRAAKGVLDALQGQPNAGTGILHWFSGTNRELDRAVALGCWFSVGPLMLASNKGRQLVELMPKDRILTETDAPFAQTNGIPLMPWDVESAYEPLSHIWGCDVDEVPLQIKANLRDLNAARPLARRRSE